MDAAARELLDQLIDAVNRDDLASAEQCLASLRAATSSDPLTERDLLARLDAGLTELKGASSDPITALQGAFVDVEGRASGEHDPIETLLAIERLGDRLEAVGELDAACEVLRIALGLALTLGDIGSAAHVERLRRYAKVLDKAGQADAAARIRVELADIQAKYGTRERKGGFGLDTTGPKPPSGDADAVIDVFYATHRNVTSDPNPYTFYGGQRSEQPDYGVATISIPKQRDKGTLEFPAAWQQRPGIRSDTCFLLKSLDPGLSQAVWSARLARRISRSPGDSEALLFVHGYNTAFWEAMLRAGQLGADLEINGAVGAYSWPSRAAKLKYDEDTGQVINRHYRLLAAMVVDIARTTKPKRLFLIAHSMGARFLVEALKLIDLQIATGEVAATDLTSLRDIVFASPDVDAADFRDNIVGLRHVGHRVTVYCSQNDDALWWGETLRHRYPRAGRNAALVADKRLIAVDTTDAGGSSLGHGDYASSAISDLFAQIWLELPADQRTWLASEQSNGARYWSFAPHYASAAKQVSLRLALLIARRCGGLQAGLAEIESRMAQRRSPDDTTFLESIAGELKLIMERAQASAGAPA